MLTAICKKQTFYFRVPAGTSRGPLLKKNSYFILVSHQGNQMATGVGECSIIPGLSPDDRDGLEDKLNEVCCDIGKAWADRNECLREWPAITAGIEMALTDLEQGGRRILYPSPFTSGELSIPIHGLIWMNEPDHMLRQIEEKLNQGFRVIKMKIGALPFEEEIKLIRHIRNRYKETEVELRLDANGAFTPNEAAGKLSRLAGFNIHSVEQPLRPGQVKAMADLCRISPIPVALDEELTGIGNPVEKRLLLEQIRPRFIVLKPSLAGGFEAVRSWIDIAGDVGCGWWINSALESRIGLNALAQWVAATGVSIVQGLGTGNLFTNDFPSPLTVSEEKLWFNPGLPWDLSTILTTEPS